MPLIYWFFFSGGNRCTIETLEGYKKVIEKDIESIEEQSVEYKKTKTKKETEAKALYIQLTDSTKIKEHVEALAKANSFMGKVRDWFVEKINRLGFSILLYRDKANEFTHIYENHKSILESMRRLDEELSRKAYRKEQAVRKLAQCTDMIIAHQKDRDSVNVELTGKKEALNELMQRENELNEQEGMLQKELSTSKHALSTSEAKLNESKESIERLMASQGTIQNPVKKTSDTLVRVRDNTNPFQQAESGVVRETNSASNVSVIIKKKLSDMRHSESHEHSTANELDNDNKSQISRPH